MRVEHLADASVPLPTAWARLTEDLQRDLPSRWRTRFAGHDVEAALRPLDADDDEHVASLRADGRAVAYRAGGSATIRVTLRRSGDTTRLKLSADVVAAGVPDDELEPATRDALVRLAALLSVPSSRVPENDGGAGLVAGLPSEAGATAAPAPRRSAAAAAALVLLALLFATRRRRRRRLAISVSYRDPRPSR